MVSTATAVVVSGSVGLGCDDLREAGLPELLDQHGQFKNLLLAEFLDQRVDIVRGEGPGETIPRGPIVSGRLTNLPSF
jgi:D-aminopeptidase